MYKKYGMLLAVILFGMFLIYRYSHQESSLFKSIHVGNQSLKVKVADTQSLRELGLGNRDTLGKADGMLFIFDTPGMYGFWMKDMKFDLDIIWIDQTGKVIGFEKNVSKNSYPKISYPPNEVRYVLEMNTGSIEKWGIKVGDSMTPLVVK